MSADDRRLELEDQRDYLLASLDDLDAEFEAGDLEDEDYRALKDDYTARAAAVLRRLDELNGVRKGKKRPAKRRPAAAPTPAPPSSAPPSSAPSTAEAAGADNPGADESGADQSADVKARTGGAKRKRRRPAAAGGPKVRGASVTTSTDRNRATNTGAETDTDRDTASATNRDADAVEEDVVGPRRRRRAGADISPSDRPTGRSRSNLVLAVAGSVAFIALAVWLITANTGARGVGEQATGSVPMMGGQATENCAMAGGSFQRAQCFDKQGRILEALKAYDEVVAADPNNVMAWSQAGWMLVRTNNPELMEKGLIRIDRALTIDPQFAQAHFFKGSALQRMGRPGEAVCELRIFMGLVPPGGTEAQMVEPLLKGATEQAQQNNQPIDCKPLPINPAGGEPVPAASRAEPPAPPG